MTKTNTGIEFESREEIDVIIKALEASKDHSKPEVQELIRKLDYIIMEW